MVRAKTPNLRMRTWRSFPSSLLLCWLACSGPQRPRAADCPTVPSVTTAPTVPPGLTTARWSESLDAGPEAAATISSAPDEKAETIDAQARLLELLRRGKTLYARQALPAGVACIKVEPRPSLPDGSAGELRFGGALPAGGHTRGIGIAPRRARIHQARCFAITAPARPTIPAIRICAGRPRSGFRKPAASPSTPPGVGSPRAA